MEDITDITHLGPSTKSNCRSVRRKSLVPIVSISLHPMIIARSFIGALELVQPEGSHHGTTSGSIWELILLMTRIE